MGTVFSFAIAAPGVDNDVLDDVIAWLHHVDATFSTYRDDSEVSRIAAGTLSPDRASAEVREVIAACEQWSRDTDCWFDATAAGRFDPSGYVKGWAIGRAADLLSAAGSANHCVNGGGDVMCVGRPAPGRPWRIGIADPDSREQLLGTVEREGPLGVATSGTAERGAHVFDPHTGRPATALRSVTVCTASVVEADVLATAALAMGPAAHDWLAGRPGVSAFLVAADGTVSTTAGPARPID